MESGTNMGNYLQIDLQALEHNACTVTRTVGVPVIGVVKFDGYGMTIPVAARAWQKAGVTMFAVAESREALALRQAGFTEDILLMAPVGDKAVLSRLLENNIILTVSDLDNARFYCANRGDYTLRVHVKVDTGMGRFGIRWTDTAQLTEVYKLEGLQPEGIFSHLTNTFEKEFKLSKLQLKRFLQAVQAVEAAGFAPGLRHIANSCAALRFPETWLDAVRVGSALVGSLLVPVEADLKRVHTFYAQVVAVKALEKGDTMGYAAVCKAKKPVRAVVAAVGTSYGFAMTGAPDPYPWRDFLSYLYHLLLRYRNQPRASFNGKQLKLIGRVGSQYTLFDATGVDVKPGDYITVGVSLLSCPSPRVFR